jgi:polar amino acid transport system substrate-binding protein
MKLLPWLFLSFMFTSFFSFACSKTLVVATHDTYWPPYIVSRGSVIEGSEIKALEIIFSDIDLCYSVIILPNSKRAFIEHINGRVDLGLAASYTQERAKYLRFSDSYRFEVMRVFGNKNNKHNVKTLADIFSQGLIVGAHLGSFYGPEIEKYKTTHSTQFVYTNSSSSRFEMLEKQRVDYIIEDALVGDFMINTHPNTYAVSSMSNVNLSSIHFMLSKKTTSLDDLEKINSQIKAKSAQLKALFDDVTAL